MLKAGGQIIIRHSHSSHPDVIPRIYSKIWKKLLSLAVKEIRGLIRSILYSQNKDHILHLSSGTISV
jgi:hypothetical protein